MEKEKVFISHGDIILDKIYDDDLNLLKQDGGGCNWNDLYNLSILGETCYAIGSRGNDNEGTLAVQALANANVNTDYVITENKRTNVMNIIVPNSKLGDNSVIHSWYSPITNEFTMNFSNNLPTFLPRELENKELYIILDKFLPVNLQFIKNLSIQKCKNYKVCLDVGHIRFFEHFTRQYLSSFFNLAKFVQINDNVTDLLFERFNVHDEIEFFNLFDFDLLVLTKGKNGARFVFNINNKIKIIDKTPEIIAEVIDSSGAGDAFFSTVVRAYAYCDKLDEDFISNTFSIANKASRDVISQVGSRIEK